MNGVAWTISQICMENSSPDSSLITLKTLGRGVALGELYNAKTSQFLGVQICPVTVIKTITHTSHPSFVDSHIRSSKSLEKKKEVLDISAELSVEILSGLISVSGAASYLNDTKSNSEEHAWGLSLHARVRQESFDVNHSKVKDNIDKTDVIDHYGSRATHVVTEIVYGGTIIISFVAKEESKIKDTHIAGKLEVQLKKLEGAFDVSGKVGVDVQEGCSEINKDLDVTIHADVALNRVPIDIETLLAMIPDACENLKNYPVPISVKLKPIPFKDFEKRGYIRHLKDIVVQNVVEKFGKLMDIQNRFSALQGSTAKHKDLIPNLASAVNGAALSFQEITTPLLERLAAYVAAYKSDKPIEIFVDLMAAVQTEIDKQKSSSQTFFGYLTHLAGLEDAFKSFSLLIYKIANRKINAMFYITPLPDLRKDIVFSPIVALLIIPPLPAQPDQINDLAIRALLVDAVAYYTSVKPPVKLHIIYTEDLSKIDIALRGNGMFMQLEEASVFLGQKKTGAIWWTPVPKKKIKAGELCDLRPYLRWHDYLAFSAYPPRHIDQITSQTLTLRAQYYGNANVDMSLYEVAVLEGQRFTDQRGCLYSYYGFYIRRERSSMGTIDYLDVNVSIDGKRLGYLVDRGSGLKNLNPMQHFHCAFVQDCEKSSATWTLYVNGAPVGKMAGSINAMSRWKSLLSGGISCDNLMTGKLYDVRVYDTALTPIQIVADSLNHYAVEKAS